MAALSTVAKLKQLLQIDDSNCDELLTLLLEAASAWIATQCCYPDGSMTSAERTFTFSGEDTRGWSPPVHPVTAVASVTIDDEVVPARDPATDGFWLSDFGRVQLTGAYRFTRGQGNCVIVATCGFPEDGIPPDLESAALSVAAQRFQERNRLGQVSSNVGGVQVTFSTFSVPSDVNLTIAAYRLGTF